MTADGHMTIAEVEEKLAVLDAAHAVAVKAQEDGFDRERKATLARLAKIRKEERVALAAIHKAERAKLVAYLDVLKLESLRAEAAGGNTNES